ncbi:hypothetical protein EDD16DRAFT_1557576, partial [Pisolithus croceorrhizus]
MTCTAPVLGVGPAGVAAALMLSRNNVPVRIIEKESQHHRGRRDAGQTSHIRGLPLPPCSKNPRTPERYSFDPGTRKGDRSNLL